MTTFSVAVHRPSADQAAAITEAFRSRGLSWWHWIDGYWLIADSRSEYTTSEIRDFVKLLCPGSNLLVIEVAGNNWSGSGKPRGDKKMFPWLHRNMKKL